MSGCTKRVLFLLVSGLALLLMAAWRPVIYGNSEGEIRRYLRQEVGLRLEDRIQLLEIQDEGEGRFVVFCGERKRPDDRWIIRFRKNETGDYEACDGAFFQLTELEIGIYRGPLGNYGRDQGNYFVGWIENPKATEVYVRFGATKEHLIRLTKVPQCVVLYDPYSHVTEYRFHGADGSEL